MKSINRWHSIVALVIVTCMLVVPVSAFGKKGRDNFNRGMKYEQTQQWEKAAQEFTLALAADPSNVDYQLHYRRAIFNASQMFMQQGRSLAEARDYVGAYNAFRQAFGYDPVNQLAVSEMERMVRLQEVKDGKPRPVTGDGKSNSEGTGTPASTSNARSQEPLPPSRVEQMRVVNFNGDLRQFIRKMADELNLNVIFDRQTFAQPRNIDVSLRDVTTAKALDYIFLQENLFFQKLDRRTILVADQARRQQYQQLVVRTFYISNSDPDKAKQLITQALPASVGRPQSIVVSDKDTNSLTVRDTAENVKLIGDLLESIDKDRAEVVMDVNIYEVNRSSFLQFGAQWGTDQFAIGGSPGLAVPTGNVLSSDTKTGVNLSSITGLSPTALAAALVLPPLAFNAWQSKNNGRLLASTQIHAFNNEESTARIGQRVPVQTAQAYPFGVQTGTPNTGAGNNFPTGGFPVINYEPTGLTLNFTPQVFPNLDVQVKMKIESKDVTGEKTLTPTFTERTLTGTARVQNNRTMMLASVSQDVQSSGRQGLPVLGGLPIIGRFFSSPTNQNRQVDIVITVTPRVLRAPAVTPRDEEMRPSGTLTSPTTGSLEAMMRETEREEQYAAARKIPRDVTVAVAEPTVTYAPAPLAAAQTVANSEKTGSTSPQVVSLLQTNNAAPPQTQTVASIAPSLTQTAALSAPAKSDGVATDAAMPQPKALAGAPAIEQAAAQKLDVAGALKSIVSPTTGVSGTAASSKQDATLSPVVEDLAPKSEKTETTARASDSVVELGLATGQGDMRVGEKRQLALSVKTGAPLGLAVLTLRFDPKVVKVNSVTAGGIFANAKTAPAVSQSIDPNGMLLVSIAPGAGSPLGGEGVLLNIEFEAIAGGDSLLTFDLANVHLVASDGRNLLLQVEPVKLTVK
ncbi:MAG TPA: secretin N-terminal domain-containing protein [Pyrinomonadaceae bacterium]|nr:secretin N-terminal domain-containing protein [Pyrinomonadaceae bacterium]